MDWNIKYRDVGKIEWCKARQVAKGYNVTEGLDYTKTFSPVAWMVTIGCLLAIVAIKVWNFLQLDVNNVSFAWRFERRGYMKLSHGSQNNNGNSQVYKLRKSLYGLSISSMVLEIFSYSLKYWLQIISSWLYYLYKIVGPFIHLLVYVDEICSWQWSWSYIRT